MGFIYSSLNKSDSESWSQFDNRIARMLPFVTGMAYFDLRNYDARTGEFGAYAEWDRELESVLGYVLPDGGYFVKATIAQAYRLHGLGCGLPVYMKLISHNGKLYPYRTYVMMDGRPYSLEFGGGELIPIDDRYVELGCAAAREIHPETVSAGAGSQRFAAGGSQRLTLGSGQRFTWNGSRMRKLFGSQGGFRYLTGSQYKLLGGSQRFTFGSSQRFMWNSSQRFTWNSSQMRWLFGSQGGFRYLTGSQYRLLGGSQRFTWNGSRMRRLFGSQGGFRYLMGSQYRLLGGSQRLMLGGSQRFMWNSSQRFTWNGSQMRRLFGSQGGFRYLTGSQYRLLGGSQRFTLGGSQRFTRNGSQRLGMVARDNVPCQIQNVVDSTKVSQELLMEFPQEWQLINKGRRPEKRIGGNARFGYGLDLI